MGLRERRFWLGYRRSRFASRSPSSVTSMAALSSRQTRCHAGQHRLLLGMTVRGGAPLRVLRRVRRPPFVWRSRRPCSPGRLAAAGSAGTLTKSPKRSARLHKELRPPSSADRVWTCGPSFPACPGGLLGPATPVGELRRGRYFSFGRGIRLRARRPVAWPFQDSSPLGGRRPQGGLASVSSGPWRYCGCRGVGVACCGRAWPPRGPQVLSPGILFGRPAGYSQSPWGEAAWPPSVIFARWRGRLARARRRLEVGRPGKWIAGFAPFGARRRRASPLRARPCAPSSPKSRCLATARTTCRRLPAGTWRPV